MRRAPTRARCRWAAAFASRCTTSARHGASGTLREYVSGGLGWILGIERELGELEARMAEGSSDAATLDAYADAQARLEHAGGYRWRDGVVAALRGLGFDESELDRSLATFSGGELTRASLARALASKPDLLLMDEPTNHLDIGSLEWLEGYLREVDAAVVLVAHDRWFLEAVGTSVLELEAGRGRYFDGPWHAWRTEKAQRALADGREIERSQAEIARMQRFVDRFRYKAKKARMAQSRVKRIERVRRSMPTVDPTDSRSLSFSFGDAERSGRVVLELGRRADRGRRPAARRERGPVAGARRARLPDRAERVRQVDPGLRPSPASASWRRASCSVGHNVKTGLSAPARRGAGIRVGDRAHPCPALNRAVRGEDAGAARAVSVLRRGG